MIDMKETEQKDEDEYILMYKENGIDFIDKSAEFYYFRGNNDSNTTSLIQCEKGRYLNRINSHKKIIGLAGLLNLIIFILNFTNHLRIKSEVLSYIPFINLSVGVFCIWIYISIDEKIKILKEDGIKSPYKTNIKDWPKFYSLVFIMVSLIIIYGILSLFNL